MKHDSNSYRIVLEGQDKCSARRLSLKLYPDSVLRTPCQPMEHFDGWLSDVVDEMFELMRKHNGIGLAAPQVGITQQLFVAEIDGRSLCLINPSIGSSSGYDQMVEGCLSLPGVLVDMERGGLIDVTGYDSVGQRRQELLQGLWARVVQHEIDHLDGVLIRDYVEPYQNKTLKRETTRARTR